MSRLIILNLTDDERLPWRKASATARAMRFAPAAT